MGCSASAEASEAHLDLSDSIQDELDVATEIEAAGPAGLQSLDVGRSRLLTLPWETLARCGALTELRAAHNQLTFVDLRVMLQLERLNLADNRIEQLPREVGRMTSLRSLDVGRNCLRSLPSELWSLPRLEHLYVGRNRLHAVPAAVARLQCLRRLSWAGNGLDSIPEELCRLRQLRVLDLSDNHILELTASIAGLESLQELNLSGNLLRSLSGISSLAPSLRILRCADNRLWELPPEIGRLSWLRVLDAGNGGGARHPSYSNSLRTLPEELWELEQLEELVLRGNLLESISPRIVACSRLRCLNLFGNRIRSLPPEIGDLPELAPSGFTVRGNPLCTDDTGAEAVFLQLREDARRRSDALEQARSSSSSSKEWDERLGRLDLSWHDLTEWPTAEIEQAGPENIRCLCLAGNRLTSIPGAELARLTELEDLNVSSNKLESLPDELWALTRLRFLYLSYNAGIAKLPEEITRLQRLEGLFASDLQLRALPPGLSSLQSLSLVWVERNQLDALPAELGALRKLSADTFCCTPNPLAALPAHVPRSDSAILQYLRSEAAAIGLTPPRDSSASLPGPLLTPGPPMVLATPSPVPVEGSDFDFDLMEGLEGQTGRSRSHYDLSHLSWDSLGTEDEAEDGAGGVAPRPDWSLHVACEAPLEGDASAELEPPPPAAADGNVPAAAESEAPAAVEPDPKPPAGSERGAPTPPPTGELDDGSRAATPIAPRAAPDEPAAFCTCSPGSPRKPRRSRLSAAALEAGRGAVVAATDPWGVAGALLVLLVCFCYSWGIFVFGPDEIVIL